MGKFKKGMMIGSILGAAMVWLNISTKGKKYRDQLLDQASDVYTRVLERIAQSGTFTQMTKSKYVTIVKEVVHKYAIDNGLAENTKNMIVKIVANQWNAAKKQMKK